MIQRVGILLLEKSEVVIRIYEVDEKEWRLLHYQCIQLQSPDGKHSTLIIESLADFLASNDSMQVSEWKLAARGISHEDTAQISSAVGLHIESINPLREQELLCKGLFTELW
jgi:hypothetical protein